MLTELTSAQWDTIHTRRDTLIAEVCGPTISEQATADAVRACYAAIDKPEPAIVWVDGPLSVLRAGGQFGGQLRGQFGGQLGDQLRDQLGDQLGDQLWGQLGGSVMSGWLIARTAFYLAINDLPGINPVPIDLRRKAEAWLDALKCHMWLPLEGAAIMCRQHVALHRNDRGELHNPAGPAWEWADGTTLWALEGIRIPDWVITDPDPARYLADLTNSEQRRVAFAEYGWDRAAAELGWRVLDRSDDPYTGTLYRLPDGLMEDEDGDPLNLLVGRNASPHPDGKHALYGLPVAGGHRTAVEAQASLWGISAREWEQVEVKT